MNVDALIFKHIVLKKKYTKLIYLYLTVYSKFIHNYSKFVYKEMKKQL